MLIFYCCYGRAHSSITAAALHLGKIQQPFTLRSISKIADFDKATSLDIGIPKCVGCDNYGNAIFVLGCGAVTHLVIKVLTAIYTNNGFSQNEIMFVDLKKYLNVCVRVGGFMSRRLGFVFPGRQIAAYGIYQVIHEIEDCVNDTKKRSRVDGGKRIRA